MNKIKYYRNKAKLTQAELAKKVGCSRQTINIIEKGHRDNINMGILKSLSQVLNVTVDVLFFDNTVNKS